MKLVTAEIVPGGQAAGARFNAAFHKLPIVRPPLGQVLAVEKHDGIRRGGRGSGRGTRIDALRRGAVRIVHEVAAPRKLGSVLVAIDAGTVFGINQLVGAQDVR